MEEKNLGGAPQLYKEPKDLEDKVNEYFEYVKGEFQYSASSDDEGNPVDKKVYIREPEHVTITGLCLYLGFESRQSFYDYEKRSGFSYIIKRARLMVENKYESSALDAKVPTFQIFALKNMGWSDKQEIDHQSTDGSMTPKINIIKPNGD